MVRNTLTVTLFAAMLLAMLGGCGQYNGAPGMEVGNVGAHDAYARFLAERDLKRQERRAQLDSLEPLADALNPNTEGITYLSPEMLTGGVVQTEPSTTGWVDERSDAAFNRLGLWGQLPQHVPQRRGALDGPDNLAQVTFATDGADMDPEVDATGQMIVFASTRHRQTPDIYLQKIDGTAVQQITHDASSDRMPTFSPDGRRIAFASDRSGNWDIYLTDLDGSSPIQLTNDSTHEVHPSFSPDGKHLVYCSYGSQSGQWEMVVVDVDNPATKRFIGFGLFPSWSPVDSKIAYQRPRQRGTHWFSVWTIEYIDGEGLRPTEIAASANAGVITPQWSPDGRHLVFSTVINPSAQNVGPQQADVWICEADGSNRVNLTTNNFSNIQPAWATNGSIYFVSNRAAKGVENVWAVAPDEVIRLTQRRGGALPATADVPTDGQ